MHSIFEGVTPETAEMLAARAKERGLSIDVYLKTLLGLINGAESVTLSQAEFETDLQSFSEGTEDLPPIAFTYSRKDIYFDRD